VLKAGNLLQYIAIYCNILQPSLRVSLLRYDYSVIVLPSITIVPR